MATSKISLTKGVNQGNISEVSVVDNISMVDKAGVFDKVNIRSFWLKIAIFKNIIWLKESKTRFFTLGARLAFIKLRQAIIKTLILHYFDLKCHILITTNILG